MLIPIINNRLSLKSHTQSSKDKGFKSPLLHQQNDQQQLSKELNPKVRKKPNLQGVRIKILRSHAEKIARQRDMVKVYKTNVHEKPAALFYYLKSLTTSGIIRDWKKQRAAICAALDWTRPTFNRWLSYAQTLRFLTFDKQNIYLNSYEQILEENDLPATKFCTVTLPDVSHVRLLPLVFHVIELEINKEKQDVVIQRKLHTNPGRAEAIMELIDCWDSGALLQSLRAAQKQGFTNGSESAKTLYQINADNNRGVRKLGETWDYKCTRSVSYVKKRLEKAGLVKIEKQAFTGTFAAYCVHNHTAWNPVFRQRTTYQPDRISANIEFFRL